MPAPISSQRVATAQVVYPLGDSGFKLYLTLMVKAGVIYDQFQYHPLCTVVQTLLAKSLLCNTQDNLEQQLRTVLQRYCEQNASQKQSTLSRWINTHRPSYRGAKSLIENRDMTGLDFIRHVCQLVDGYLATYAGELRNAVLLVVYFNLFARTDFFAQRQRLEQLALHYRFAQRIASASGASAAAFACAISPSAQPKIFAACVAQLEQRSPQVGYNEIYSL